MVATIWLLGCDPATARADADAAGGAVDPIHVAVAPVERSNLAAIYGTSATLRAEARATVTSRARGVLEAVLVEEGAAVETGQVLARLEDDEQELAVTRAEAVHEMKLRELQRLEELNRQEMTSDRAVDASRREAEVADMDLEIARLNLTRTAIRAPFDGVIVTRHQDVGATVGDGTPMFAVADLDPLLVDVSIPERHVGRLAPRQSVRLVPDGAETPIEARIERLAPVVDPGTGTVKVTASVDRAVHLRPGAFVEVQIVTDVHEDVLVVPRTALVAEGRRWHVFRPSPDGATVQAIEVEVGFEEGDRVEVKAVGDATLAEGDNVVVTGASALTDGAGVRILSHPGVGAPVPVSERE
ncbi:MAG: efflux RND transporter periplasmic adaptor subunit [Planctomycetota bacterium]